MSRIDHITDEDWAQLSRTLDARANEDLTIEDEDDDPLEPEEAWDPTNFTQERYDALVRRERARGVQEALQIMMGATLTASIQEPVSNGRDRAAPMDLHTIEALAHIVERRTGVMYSGVRLK